MFIPEHDGYMAAPGYVQGSEQKKKMQYSTGEK
jgi:hypothetical protein